MSTDIWRIEVPNLPRRLYIAQRGLCFHCGKPMLPTVCRKDGQTHDAGWTREHVVPKSLGGRNDKNIVLAHLGCNMRRGADHPTPEMIERAREIWNRV